MRLITRFLYHDEANATTEYAVLLALILMAIIEGISAIGTRTTGIWVFINTSLRGVGLGL